ncbi:Cyclic pyranopterin monophosphate synthase [Rhynchospora pubera]|uniref:cyclic pyranopterin monophosphate synthase n=1 Tax=Rhynchospora pubera TaxID=906938 RepID=A0AAV8EQG9_9POAL|nr:Cyclic pyranopterin monophosphate synthase [Rhynchospora pubera]
MSIYGTLYRKRIAASWFFQRRFSNSGVNYPAIDELNKELESIFGERPLSSSLNSTPTIEPEYNPNSDQKPQLTHVDSTGQAKMVDISHKGDTKRVAIATCRVLLGPKVFPLVASNQIAKGDVLNVAKLAGIMGAKNTSSLIPLCHNIMLSNVRVDLKLNDKDYSVEIEGEVGTTGQTGVEMEALTAVSVAGLTVYDMCKAASKDICVTDICLQQKSGGKSGSWSRGK